MIATSEFNYFTPEQITSEETVSLKNDWQQYASQEKKFKGQKIGEGKGIVITAGGLKYFTSAWVLVVTLRNLGCELPIEIWFHGNELTRGMRTQLKKNNVTCRDMRYFVEERPHGFLMKPLSIMFSEFKEVLFLDADNTCVKDPSYLFQDTHYLDFGCMFWPDYWHTSTNNPIWSILDVEYFNCNEQDSGQLIIDKSRCWDQMQLCIYFNLNGDKYYKFLYGDKDTFKFAWLALKRNYYMVTYDVGSCGSIDKNNEFYGNTMVQYDPAGKIIFLHRNLIKWDITLPGERIWEIIKRFSSNAYNNRCYLKQSPKSQVAIELEGDVTETPFDKLFPGFEERCLVTLEQLEQHGFINMNFSNTISQSIDPL